MRNFVVLGEIYANRVGAKWRPHHVGAVEQLQYPDTLQNLEECAKGVLHLYYMEPFTLY